MSVELKTSDVFESLISGTAGASLLAVAGGPIGQVIVVIGEGIIIKEAINDLSEIQKRKQLLMNQQFKILTQFLNHRVFLIVDTNN